MKKRARAYKTQEWERKRIKNANKHTITIGGWQHFFLHSFIRYFIVAFELFTGDESSTNWWRNASCRLYTVLSVAVQIDNVCFCGFFSLFVVVAITYFSFNYFYYCYFFQNSILNFIYISNFVCAVWHWRGGWLLWHPLHT